jgi:hypothetical protein
MMPQQVIQSKLAYLPVVKIKLSGNQLKIKRKQNINPMKTLR